MRARSILVTVLAGAFLAACMSHGSRPFLDDSTLNTSASAPPPFQSLLEKMRGSNFSLLFDAKLQGSNGQLLWRRSGAIERFDLFVKLPHGEMQLAGDSIIFANGENSGDCSWLFVKGAETELDCAGGTGSIVDVQSLFITVLTDLQSNMQYLGTREIVGQTAYCYAAAIDNHVGRSQEAANICVTDHGLPLSIDSGRYLDGPASIRAVANQPVTYEDLGVLPGNQATRGAQPTHLCASDLRLPRMPSVDQYLANLSPEDRQCTLPAPKPGTSVSPPHDG